MTSKETTPPAQEIERELTAQKIFLKISELQNLMTDIFNSLALIEDSLRAAIGKDGECDEGCNERISNVCNVFLAREANYEKLLALYEKMYDDIRNKNKR